MKNIRQHICFLIIAGWFVMSFVKQNKTTQEKSFATLNRLNGTWQMPTAKGILYENWVRVNDTAMLGKTYRVKNADTVFMEHVDLILDGGSIYYIPTTVGQNDEKPVRFKLSSTRQNQYIFENLVHDFPKRIVYKFVSVDSIHAFIDDAKLNGNRMDYFYNKVK
jgi:hypothetical protein